ncbi:MAG: helix-turn-helix transcriptional regulator [Candidatus Brevundimonas colombiensis]|jgi:transcriptional regulator with XRE-family HTH domain|uniref:Helix-turn-helix transcriptional regulator n=1 Tax=Candidatus Brevundimonas colombiensis TaxID=3121376 RepID=A0AAJ5WYG7_9CAUL|nr:helix-turn-helix transcriptional regulator [Brevundimonas sp.]WEK38594.1 MAG: helix-turn-helix transcriptional regulator [Brevundimonas sp.]
MDWKVWLGRNIRQCRKAKGWSQQTLAGEANLSLRYLAGVERGEENPSLETIVAIAAAMNVSPSALFVRPDAS